MDGQPNWAMPYVPVCGTPVLPVRNIPSNAKCKDERYVTSTNSFMLAHAGNAEMSKALGMTSRNLRLKGEQIKGGRRHEYR